MNFDSGIFQWAGGGFIIVRDSIKFDGIYGPAIYRMNGIKAKFTNNNNI